MPEKTKQNKNMAIPIPIMCWGECCPNYVLLRFIPWKVIYPQFRAESGLLWDDGDILFEEIMDGLIIGKLFCYKNLIFLINQFFLFDISCFCVYFCWFKFKTQQKQNKTKQKHRTRTLRRLAWECLICIPPFLLASWFLLWGHKKLSSQRRRN